MVIESQSIGQAMQTWPSDLQFNAFDALIGLRLSIVRRAADMLGLHFGDTRPEESGEGTVGAYALHVQCP
jgi:hypothetical protein